MKFECNLEKLKIGILMAEKVIGKNMTLPVLGAILLVNEKNILNLKATNLNLGLEIKIPVKTEKEGTVAVSGSALAGIFSNFNQKDETLSVEEENGNLLIKTKNNKMKLKGQAHDDFPTIPSVSGQEMEIDSKKLVDGIKSVFYSSSTSDVKPEISSVYLYKDEENIVFVSTDSFRLAEKKIKVKGLGEIPPILIPYKNISEILRIFGEVNDTVKVVFSKNQISFSCGGIYLTSRIIDGIFPDYRQIIPKDFETEVIVLKQDLLNALKLSNIFSDKFNQVDLKVLLKEKKLEISSSNGEIGENKSLLDAVVSGQNIELSFNYKYLLDSMQSIVSDSVILRLSANKPILVFGNSDSSFKYLIMPMNK